MPYSSNSDLNPKVKKAHPSKKGRTAFRKAFNNALQEYGDEATAFKVAHSAADRAEGSHPHDPGHKDHLPHAHTSAHH